MVNVLTGGRKKKLRHATAATDAIVASKIPHADAIERMTTRYDRATVVGFTASSAPQTIVTAPTAATDAAERKVERMATDTVRI